MDIRHALRRHNLSKDGAGTPKNELTHGDCVLIQDLLDTARRLRLYSIVADTDKYTISIRFREGMLGDSLGVGDGRIRDYYDIVDGELVYTSTMRF